MKEITCSIINDLLPLYVDDALCSDSIMLVEEHIEGCKFCRSELESMKKPIIVAKNSDRSRIKEMERRISNRRFIGVTILLFVVLVMIVLLGVWWGKSHDDMLKGATGELVNYFVLSALMLFFFSAIWYWGVFSVIHIRRLMGKEPVKSLKRICIVSACTLLSVFTVVTISFFTMYYGSPSNAENIDLQTEFQYSEDSYLNQEWVVHFTSKNNKAINVFREETYNDDHVVTGLVYTVHEVPIKAVLESDNYTAGYSYGDKTSNLINGFDFTVTIVFHDKTVVYSMRKEGLFEKQNNVAFTPDNAVQNSESRSANGIVGIYDN